MENELLRHLLATISYRFEKVVKHMELDFGTFSAGSGTRTPQEILNHMYQVLHVTGVFIQEGRFIKVTPAQLLLQGEIDRFNTELTKVDEILAAKSLEVPYAKRLIQGPLSDLLTHVGQLSMLSRLYGKPIAGEDFSSAKVGD